MDDEGTLRMLHHAIETSLVPFVQEYKKDHRKGGSAAAAASMHLAALPQKEHTFKVEGIDAQFLTLYRRIILKWFLTTLNSVASMHSMVADTHPSWVFMATSELMGGWRMTVTMQQQPVHAKSANVVVAYDLMLKWQIAYAGSTPTPTPTPTPFPPSATPPLPSATPIADVVSFIDFNDGQENAETEVNEVLAVNIDNFIVRYRNNNLPSTPLKLNANLTIVNIPDQQYFDDSSTQIPSILIDAMIKGKIIGDTSKFKNSTSKTARSRSHETVIPLKQKLMLSFVLEETKEESWSTNGTYTLSMHLMVFDKDRFRGLRKFRTLYHTFTDAEIGQMCLNKDSEIMWVNQDGVLESYPVKEMRTQASSCLSHSETFRQAMLQLSIMHNGKSSFKEFHLGAAAPELGAEVAYHRFVFG
jgi:hypothetical protein